MVEQDALTSPTLIAMLRSAVAAAHPHIPVQGRHKVELLEAVLAKAGWPAVFALGMHAKTLGDHPVVRALVSASDPGTLLDRWRRLERFGHSRNRMLVVGRVQVDHVHLRHIAEDGSHIAQVDDLFVWGLLIALLEAAGTQALSGSFLAAETRLDRFYPDHCGALPHHTASVVLRWGPPCETAEPASALVEAMDAMDATGVGARLKALLRDDLLSAWTMSKASRALGLSGRSLQRALQAEGTTFSETLQRVRVSTADLLMRDERLSLAEIAFSTGFSDQAHFTRTFRRYFDVPPSALRGFLARKPPCELP